MHICMHVYMWTARIIHTEKKYLHKYHYQTYLVINKLIHEYNVLECEPQSYVLIEQKQRSKADCFLLEH